MKCTPMMSLLMLLCSACGGELIDIDTPKTEPACVLSDGTLVESTEAVDCARLDHVVNIVATILEANGYYVKPHLESLTIAVQTVPIRCGVSTLGCTWSAELLEVSTWEPPLTSWLNYGSDCYELILSHEMIHWALRALDLAHDPTHEDPTLFGPGSLADRAWSAVLVNLCAGGVQ